VNQAFYAAFRDRDMGAMERIWARHVPVACMHPGMKVLLGRDAVMRSWRAILRHPGAPTVEASATEVHLLGTSAFVTCLEGSPGDTPKLITTNVFTREEGFWRMVHHHSAPLSPSALPQQKRASDPPDPSTLN